MRTIYLPIYYAICYGQIHVTKLSGSSFRLSVINSNDCLESSGRRRRSWCDQGVNAVGGLGHHGGEGGRLCGEFGNDSDAGLPQVVVGETTQGEASEGNRLLDHAGSLRLAGGTALGDGHLGNAQLAGALDGQMSQHGAFASRDLVSFGHLCWLDVDLGALLVFSLQFIQDGGVGLSQRADIGLDHVAGNFQLGLGVDALAGAGDVGLDLVVEVAAESAQPVLEERRGQDLDDLSVRPQLVEHQLWAPDDDDTVHGLEEGGVDATANDDADGF